MTKIEEIDKTIADLRNQKEQILKSRTVKCSHCNKRTALKNATVVRNFSYVPPSGCTDGAYWATNGEYNYYCAKCGHFNRAYVLGWEKEGKTNNHVSLKPETRKYDIDRVALHKFIEMHYSYFGEHLDDYDKGGTIEEMRERDIKRKQAEKDRGW